MALTGHHPYHTDEDELCVAGCWASEHGQEFLHFSESWYSSGGACLCHLSGA